MSTTPMSAGAAAEASGVSTVPLRLEVIKLPELAGGLSVALARSFNQIDPAVKKPQSEHWERAFALFDLLL